METRRKLAKADPFAHQAGLAQSLNQLGALLSNVGRDAEARAATAEAAQMRQALAPASPLRLAWRRLTGTKPIIPESDLALSCTT